jgi:hypothetical protein
MYWNFISILKLELSSSISEPLNNELSIIHVSHNNCATAVTDVEDVGNRVWNDELVRNLLLSADNYGISSSDSDGSLAEHMDGLESVFHLIDATIWRENLH